MKYEKIKFTKYSISIDTGSSLAPLTAYFPDLKSWHDSFEAAEAVVAEAKARSATEYPLLPMGISIQKHQFTRIVGGPEDGAIYNFGGKTRLTMADFND